MKIIDRDMPDWVSRARLLLRENRISFKSLADKTFFSYGYISLIMRGKVIISTETITIINKAINELIKEKQKENKNYEEKLQILKNKMKDKDMRIDELAIKAGYSTSYVYNILNKYRKSDKMLDLLNSSISK